MTEEQPLVPRVQPPPRRANRSRKPPRRRGAHIPSRDDERRLEHPLNEIAPHLEPPWFKEDSDTPERTTLYTHPEGHRIGLRLQPGGMSIQTWITAGPDLPPIPAGTAEEKADAQAANDARLQPGRTWHAVLITHTSKALAADLGALVHERLLPALTNKPRGFPAPAPPAGIGQPDTAPQKEGTQK
ncbi:hypothetical protein [Streptomyces sp. BP-8]|uniref:DUF317 domain-containing protein n=1 Tax=Streptomyces sirii TaxID=3127701 RepID=A0ABZ2QKC2_9ACTN